MMPIFPDQHFLFLIFVFTTALKQSGYSLSFKDYFILLSGTCCQLLISFFFTWDVDSTSQGEAEFET